MDLKQREHLRSLPLPEKPMPSEYEKLQYHLSQAQAIAQREDLPMIRYKLKPMAKYIEVFSKLINTTDDMLSFVIRTFNQRRYMRIVFKENLYRPHDDKGLPPNFCIEVLKFDSDITLNVGELFFDGQKDDINYHASHTLPVGITGRDAYLIICAVCSQCEKIAAQPPI